MKVTKHIAKYLLDEGLLLQEPPFDIITIEKLLELEWVEKFKENKEFFRFSISPFILEDTQEEGFFLMAEKRHGKSWDIVARVIGSIEKARQSLPDWKRLNSTSFFAG